MPMSEGILRLHALLMAKTVELSSRKVLMHKKYLSGCEITLKYALGVRGVLQLFQLLKYI